jgi:hypothetical protein
MNRNSGSINFSRYIPTISASSLRRVLSHDSKMDDTLSIPGAKASRPVLEMVAGEQPSRESTSKISRQWSTIGILSAGCRVQGLGSRVQV